MKQKRPQTLLEVSQLGKHHGNYDAFLREWVDEVDKVTDGEQKRLMVLDEPIVLDHPIANAYLAAVAEYVCRMASVRPPTWTEKDKYFLTRPHFGSSLQSHKALLIAQSPSAFRRRMIFVDNYPLSRPHYKTSA